jgi:hypothetical protein
MQEPYDQGLANQIGPAPCADVREGMGEASVRGSAGWVSSRESNTFETPTLWVSGEGNTAWGALSGESHGRSRVVIGPRHVRTLLAREPGDLSFGRRHVAAGPHRGGR